MAEDTKLSSKHFWMGALKVAIGVSVGIVIGIPTVSFVRGLFKNVSTTVATNAGTAADAGAK